MLDIRITKTMENVQDDDIVTGESGEIGFLYNARELIIFMIDSTEGMFQEDTNFFNLCLQCCKTTVLNKIENNSKDLISIVFFGIQPTVNTSQNIKGVFSLHTPHVTSPDMVNSITKVMKTVKEGTFDVNYGSSCDYSLAEMLWYCCSLVRNTTVKIHMSTIFLMTCNDDPHKDNQVQQFQARKRASDLSSLGIRLQLLHLGDGFDIDVFYRDVLQAANTDDSQLMPIHPAKDINELLERVSKRCSKKRSNGKIPLVLGQNNIILEVFCLYRRTTMPPVTKLYRVTNESVSSTQQTFNSDTAERLLQSDLKKYCNLDGTRIYFGSKEYEKAQFKEKPKLIVYGFKSLSNLTPELYTRPSLFLFISETQPRGNKMLFAELIEQCFSKQKYIMCCYFALTRGKPYLVALIPQKEVLQDGMQIKPSGFNLFFLPYKHHNRNIEVGEMSSITSEQQEVFERVTRSLSFRYSPDVFRNPKLETHWSNMKLLALIDEKPTDEYQHDRMKINYDVVAKRLGDAEDKFEATFDEINESAPLKRSHGDDSGSSKRQKFGIRDVEELAKKKKLELLTVDVLKEYIKRKDIQVSKKQKPFLVDGIYKYLNVL